MGTPSKTGLRSICFARIMPGQIDASALALDPSLGVESGRRMGEARAPDWVVRCGPHPWYVMCRCVDRRRSPRLPLDVRLF